MRWGLAVTVALLILVPAATGATPLVSIQTTPAAGTAPLRVTFTAVGDAASYHWDFGDGSSADGRTAEHTYGAGRWTATLTARSANSELTTQAASVTAYGLTLAGPNPARYARRVVFGGAVAPVEQGLYITLVGPRGKIAGARTRADGSYTVGARVKLPGEYVATSERAESTPLALRIVPKLATGLAGSGARDSRYFFTARLVPANAGTLAVNVARGDNVRVDRAFAGPVRIRLDTRRLASYRIRTEVTPNEGYAATVQVLQANVVLPRLALGARVRARQPASSSALRGALHGDVRRAHARRGLCLPEGSRPAAHRDRRCPLSGARSRIPAWRSHGLRNLRRTSR